MGILDDLMQAYGTIPKAIGNALYPNGFNSGSSTTSGSSLIDALNTPVSGASPSQAANAMPALPNQASPAQIANAQSAAASNNMDLLPNNPQIVQLPPAQQPQAAPNVASAAPAAQTPPAPVAAADTSSPPPSTSADGSQAQNGGLLGALAGAGQQVASDPVQSKGLLNSLGDYAQGLGAKLKSMSPAQSQGLLAAGMTMLANNDGRHNLAQLVGTGGIAGENAYVQSNQNALANQINAAKAQAEVQHQNVQDQVAQTNAGTELYKATHPTVSAGQTVLGPNGSGGLGAIGGGGVKAAGQRTSYDPTTGVTSTQAVDEQGNLIPGTVTTSASSLSGDQQKTVNEAYTEANKQKTNLGLTQQWLTKLSPTMADANGNQVPNPNYVNIPQGWLGKGANVLTQITGDRSAGQQLGAMLGQQAYQNALATWKPGIGGRLTNTDVGLLKNGLPPDNSSSATWSQYLTAVGHLQEDVANQAQNKAEYLAANRGDMGPLHDNFQIGGKMYSKGSDFNNVAFGIGGTAPGQQGQNGAQPAQAAPAQSALIAEAQRRGWKQNANGQWVPPQQSK